MNQKSVVAGSPLKIVGSPKWTLNARDFLRGLIVSSGTAAVALLSTVIQANDFSFNWVTFRPVVIAGIAAGLVYLTKNLMTNDTTVAVDRAAN